MPIISSLSLIPAIISQKKQSLYANRIQIHKQIYKRKMMELDLKKKNIKKETIALDLWIMVKIQGKNP